MTILTVVLVFLCILFFAGGLFVVQYAMTRRDRTELFKSSTVAPSGRLIYRNEVQKGVDWFESQKFEEQCITSADGLKLKAWLLLPEKPVATVIALHGFRSWPSREFAGVAKLMFDNNIAVLYPFQRAHRISEGKYITFGVKEKFDCVQWANILATKFPELPMYLYGQSMGGATVLFSGALDLPSQVKGVIADSAYDSPVNIVKDLLQRSYHLPAYPLIWFVDIWAFLLGRFGLYSDRACKTMRADLRYLFIHGDKDDLVPFYMGKRNYDSCPAKDKSFMIVHDSGHCACCYKEESLYKKNLIRFIIPEKNEEEI